MRELLSEIREALREPGHGGAGRAGVSSLGPGHRGGPGARPEHHERPKNFTYRDLRLLLPFMRPHWRPAAAAVVMSLVSTLAVTLIPLLFKSLADDAVLRGDHGRLNQVVLSLTAALVVFTVADFLKQIYFFRFQQKTVFDIQRVMLDRLLRQPKSFFDSNSTGYLMSRGVGDAFQLQAVFSLRLVDILTKSLQLALALCVVVYLSWRLALLSLVVLPLFIFVARLLNRRARRLSRLALEKAALVSRDLEERLSAASLIKTFVAEEREVQGLLGSLRDSFRASRERFTVTAFFTFLSGIVNALGMGLVLWYGASLIIRGQMTVGELVAFSAYLGFLIDPAVFLSNLHNSFQHAFAALERVFELMNLAPESEGGEGRAAVSRLRGAVRFEGVSFSYDGRKKALDDVSFEVEPGQLVGLVGPSGAGKSTTANLILGLYQPASGQIFYDGLPSRALDLRSLRGRVGVVSQEIFLFNQSVRDNLRYGRPGASDEEVVRASLTSGSHEFICQLPDGYDTVVGEKGVRLSAGQKQRLSIARAILKDPDILILDEATSALDPLTEQTVQRMLREFSRGKTVFVIAHRLATVAACDLILAFDKGRIVQRGTHRELSAVDGLYRQVCLTEFLGMNQAAAGGHGTQLSPVPPAAI